VQKEKMKKSLLSLLFGALLSVVVFLLAYTVLEDSYIDKFLPGNNIETIIFFPMLIIAPLFAIFVHELGHLLTGLALGQKLKLFVVGFFGIKDEAGKTKVFFNKNFSYFGGVAATAPKSEKDINPKSFSKILIAGPIFSLIYFIVSLIVFFNFDSHFLLYLH